MPQLSPLWWEVSGFMVFFVVVIMVMISNMWAVEFIKVGDSVGDFEVELLW